MIELVDKIVRAGLLSVVPGLGSAQIGFQPPDAEWRARVGGTAGTSLNVHLATIVEDRPLRSNAVHREISSGAVRVVNAPERIRLHYMLSAWSQAKDSLQVAATEVEHALLGRVLAGLYRLAPLNASRILGAAEIATLPEALRVDLPTAVAPTDASPRLGEFWSTMGRPQAWKPVVDLLVTAPVVYDVHEAGGIVETILGSLSTGLGIDAIALADESVLVVGGLVRAAAGPLPGASIELHGLPGGPADGRRDLTVADGDGHFAFSGLAPGPYRVVFSHPNHPLPPPVPVTVPLASGHLDLVFP